MDEKQLVGTIIIEQIQKNIKPTKKATDFGTMSMNKAIESRNQHYRECIEIVKQVCGINDDLGFNPYQE